MRNKFKKLLSAVIALCMTLALLSPLQVRAAAKMNETRKTLSAGQSFVLKVTGTYEKAKWSSSKKAVATVNQSGKVTAKKAGNTIITAKVSGKTLRCKITVKKSNIKPRTVYKDENIIVKLKGVSETGVSGSYYIDLEIENLTNASVLVQNRETSINGYMAEYSTLSVDISPGKKVKCSIWVFGDTAEDIPANKIKSVETKLMVCNSDDWGNEYETEIFTII